MPFNLGSAAVSLYLGDQSVTVYLGSQLVTVTLPTVVDANAQRVSVGPGADVAAADSFLDVALYKWGFSPAEEQRAYPVFAFQMTGVTDPSLITGADFSVSRLLLIDDQTPSFAVDAFVIRTASTPTILPSDYQDSSALLMADFDNPGLSNGLRSLDTGGQDILVGWLKENWVADEYVFIGLKSNPLTPNFDFGLGNRGYRYGSSVGGWTPASTDAQLSIVQEPGGPA